jgi:flagellar basal-body rod protein FlgB
MGNWLSSDIEPRIPHPPSTNLENINRMTEGIEAVTRTALSLALDAASLRQQALAANIANANAVGYARQFVSFESQLGEARRGLSEGGTLDAAALSEVHPYLESNLSVPGAQPGTQPDIQLDLETAEMARNALQYQALLKGLSRHFEILSLAVADGRK